jgi:hypothetical protein
VLAWRPKGRVAGKGATTELRRLRRRHYDFRHKLIKRSGAGEMLAPTLGAGSPGTTYGGKEVKRAVAVLVVLMMLAVPAALMVPRGADAAETITIFTQERSSMQPALYACYNVADLRDDGGFNGGVGGACDGTDGTADGKTMVTLLGPCSPCRVTQSLPVKPNDQPTDYLLEPSQQGSSSQTYTFTNFLKPYIVVTMINVKTGKMLKGGCIGVERPGVPGTGMRICDGVPNGGDQDGKKNGKIKTKRLPTPSQEPETLTYKVAGSTPGSRQRR